VHKIGMSAIWAFITSWSLVGVCAADPNCVGWWRLNEGTGLTARDAGPYGNHGLLVGNPRWVAGRIDGGLDLDGELDYVNCGNDESLSLAGQITLAAWIRPRMVGNYEHQHFMGKGNQSYALKQNSDNNLEMVVYINGWRIATAHLTTAFNDIWHHVAGTYDGHAIKLYIDGVLQCTTPQSGPIHVTADPFRIGTRDGSQWFYTGQIDDVRVYNRALSASEVARLAYPEQACTPMPAHQAILTTLETTLQWDPGSTADRHLVYFSEQEDQVAQGRHLIATVAQSTCGPLLLEAGQTYYWRIDEVEQDGTTIHPGDVWQFTVQPLAAYDPQPAHEAQYVPRTTRLSWKPGYQAASHDIYFGSQASAVGNATPADSTFQANQSAATYPVSSLAYDTLYYWRIDEHRMDGSVEKGDVWHFRTLPWTGDMDPTLVGWWPLDDGSGTLAFDWSGHDNHGTVIGVPRWVNGQAGKALALDGVDDCIDVGNPSSLNITDVITVMAWVKTESAGNSQTQACVTKGNDSYGLVFGSDNTLSFRVTADECASIPIDASFNGDWHHLCGTYDGRILALYLDGTLRGQTDFQGRITSSAYNVNIGRESVGNRFALDAVIDDVQVYHRALSDADIVKVVRGDTQLAWQPFPPNGVRLDIRDVTSLQWSPGERAEAHQVYLGTDQYQVAHATDTTDGIYQGRVADCRFDLNDVSWDTKYYWRVDEIGSDGSICAGRVWSFHVLDHLGVDDFEGYTDERPNRIFETWRDRYPFSDAEGHTVEQGNQTGMTVGVDEAPYGPERTLVHGLSQQALPLTYDNTEAPYYSETARTFALSENWQAEHGRTLNRLSLWIHGRWASPNRFTDHGAGRYTVVGSGSDIWGGRDECHFVYACLAGNGSITARLESIQNTSAGAKAGIMLRQSLDARDPEVAVLMSLANRVQFQSRRLTAGATEESHTQDGGISRPHWIRLTRNGTIIKGLHSGDGVTWEMIGSSLVSLSLPGEALIGLVVTSGMDAGTACQATYSNVQVTGAATDALPLNADIGLAVNDPAGLYVGLQDNVSAHIAFVLHPEGTDAVLSPEWREWSLPLADFAAQGIDLSQVRKMIIGVGHPAEHEPGGTGKLTIDDIRLYPQ